MTNQVLILEKLKGRIRIQVMKSDPDPANLVGCERIRICRIRMFNNLGKTKHREHSTYSHLIDNKLQF